MKVFALSLPILLTSMSFAATPTRPVPAGATSGQSSSESTSTSRASATPQSSSSASSASASTVKPSLVRRVSPIHIVPSSLTIAVNTPPFGFNVIPKSTRRLFATVTNGVTNSVAWTVVSGSATLSATTGSWVDVTAGSTGTSCSYTGSASAGYGVKSNTTFTIQATSSEDPTKFQQITFNVCKPTPAVTNVPFYRTLYSGQTADIQSYVLGATDQSVTWTIATQPRGGDGKLADSTQRDTVFSATVAGRYTLVSTSVASPSHTATTTIYVTGHALPYNTTPEATEPVDCTVDPSLLGQVYDVGPSQTYQTLASVPFPTIAPGSTVRVHNEDTTGRNPTQYHEYVQIEQPGTATQPIRVCGVPDAAGNLPILDASNATGRSDTSQYVPNYGMIVLHSSNYFNWYPNYTASAYIILEGLHIRNAKTGYSYTAPDGSAGSWSDFSACLRINQGQNTEFVGNDLDTCGNGVFTAWNSSLGWGSSDLNLLVEGNHLHGNGAVNSSGSHQLYLQSWNQVVQFNRIDQYTSGAAGSNIKSRGIGDVFRYNYLGDGALRQMDLVDVQDGPAYMSFEGYLGGGSTSSYATANGDEHYPADLLAAEQEAWNSHFVYGNIYQNSTAVVPIHYGEDHDGNEQSRKGDLFWYNNTFYETICPTCLYGQSWTLFDTTAGGGNFVPQVEFQTVKPFNNIIWMDNPSMPVFYWSNYNIFIGDSGKNLLPANWGSNNMAGGSATGWNDTTQGYPYQNASELANHLNGFNSTNLVTQSSIPFNTATFTLNSAVASGAVPSGACTMPARFTYLPSLSYAVPRVASPGVGAADTTAQTQAMVAAPGTLIAQPTCH